MESLSKMNEIKQEDWLDRQLREAAPYIDDEGFTARVLQQLPPPRHVAPLVPGCHSLSDHLARERTGLSTLGRRTFSRGRGDAADDLANLVAFRPRARQRNPRYGRWRYCRHL